jgi:hypothetical protein
VGVGEEDVADVVGDADMSVFFGDTVNAAWAFARAGPERTTAA